MEARQFNWKSAVLTGIALGLIALTSQYYLYMTLIISAFIALVALIFYEKSALKNLQFWKNMVLALLVGLPLVAVAVAPYVSLNQQGGLPDRNISIVRLYSASPTDFLLPSTEHFLFGEWVGSHF